MSYFVIEEADRDEEVMLVPRLPGWANTLFTVLAVVLWLGVCLIADFPMLVVGLGLVFLLYLRWRDRLFGRI